MTQLLIAGVRCQLEPESGDFVFDPCLSPFAASHETEPDLTLRLSLASGWRRQHDDLPAPTVHREGDHFEFTRRNGFLSADEGFARCFARIDPADANPFHGQPWLMLALWGYLEHRAGLFLHGSCCEVDGRLILLLGHPQVGKSTLSRLIVAAGGACLTDEYPFVTSQADNVLAHGTPWPGIQGTPRALSAPLSAIYFLRHAPANTLSPLAPREAALRLLGNHRFFTWSPETIPAAVERIDALAAAVPVFDYGFVPTPEAVAELMETGEGAGTA